MRHHVEGRKLGRTSPHRKSLFANLAASLILHDRIETTLPKAKELRSLADRLVTLGKQQTLHARRRAISIIRNKVAVHKLFDELAHRFNGRNGGYTRLLKLGFRHGDAAPMAVIEYLSSEQKNASSDGDGAKVVKRPKAAKQKGRTEKDATSKVARGRSAGAAKPAQKAAPNVKQSAKRASPAHKVTRSGD